MTRLSFIVSLLLACASSSVHALPEQIANAAEGQKSANVIRKEFVGHELELFRAAKVSIRKAIEVAQGLHTSARVVDISFDGELDAPVYRVKTFRENQVWEDAIDANTGASVGGTVTTYIRDLPQGDRANLIALSDVKQEIIDAIVVSERVAQGSAISGGLMKEDGRLNFVIVVLRGNDLKQFILEPPHANGRRSHSVRR